MLPPGLSTLVFDLDGTLVDSAPDLADALNGVLAAHGQAPVALERLRPLVGRGARFLLEQGFEAAGIALEEARLSALIEDFLTRYRANIAARTRPFPGVAEALGALGAAGARLGVCTNKSEALSRRLLDALGLSPHFAAVLGADSRPYRKPDPRHLLDTIAALGGRPGESVMIGDSETDLKAARAAGVRVVLVEFGYTPVPAHELMPDALIGHFDALPAALGKLFPAGPGRDGGR